MNSHLSAEDLVRLLEGESLPQMSHIKDCSLCRRELETLRKIEKAAGKTNLEEVPVWFTERVMDHTRSIWSPWVLRAKVYKYRQWVWGGFGLAVVFLSQFSPKSTEPSLFDFLAPRGQKFGEMISRNYNNFLNGFREFIPFLFANGNAFIFLSVGLTLILLYFIDRYFRPPLPRSTV